MQSPYKDDFRNFGFLSAEADQMRASQRHDLSPKFLELQQHVMNALDVLEVTALEREDEFWWAAIGLWVRTLEACQGAIRLADLGMASSAVSVLRTAYECLFYAAALWRKPERLKDWKEWTEKEQRTQVKGVLKEGKSTFTSIEIENMELLLDSLTDGKKWSAYDAANDSGLLLDYQVSYRGLSLIGAHATAVSVGCYFEKDTEGKTKATIKPDFSQFSFICISVKKCLDIAIERLCESSKVITP